MNVNKKLDFFTYTPTEPVLISALSNVSYISSIMTVDDNNVPIRYTAGLADWLQQITQLEANQGYMIASTSSATFPYEIYTSTDDVPESVTINQTLQIGTYCCNSYDLLDPASNVDNCGPAPSVGLEVTTDTLSYSNAYVGDSKVFSVNATVNGASDPNITYQWRKQVLGSSALVIDGETTNQLQITVDACESELLTVWTVVVSHPDFDSVTFPPLSSSNTVEGFKIDSYVLPLFTPPDPSPTLSWTFDSNTGGPILGIYNLTPNAGYEYVIQHLNRVSGCESQPHHTSVAAFTLLTEADWESSLEISGSFNSEANGVYGEAVVAYSPNSCNYGLGYYRFRIRRKETCSTSPAIYSYSVWSDYSNVYTAEQISQG